MVPRALRRAFAAVALIAALMLALPARAEAAPWSGFEDFWGWLGRITALWDTTGKTEHPIELQDKAGACIDPNGCTDHHAVACTKWNDAGACIDPNG